MKSLLNIHEHDPAWMAQSAAIYRVMLVGIHMNLLKKEKAKENKSKN